MTKFRDKTIHASVSKKDLVEAFRSVGVVEGMILEVHTRLSSLGYVIGGEETVVDALMEAVGSNGTILMPTQTGDHGDPSAWVYPPADPNQWEKIRENMPAYSPISTPTLGMGKVCENFRNRPDVVNSTHPLVSYSAWGKYAHLLCNRQSLHFPLAEESPAARLYELKGSVLMIGTDLDTCTCMHLAEYRTECRPVVVKSAVMFSEGQRTWRKFLDLEIDSEEFVKVESGLKKKSMIRETMLNGCSIRLMPVVAAVDEATAWFSRNSVYDLYR